jgi:TolB-like protein/DNA-binding winged helix-turn-helix (wHTH) protein
MYRDFGQHKMIYKFNNIKIDTKNYRLLKDEKIVAVEPQVFNLIMYLIKNKDRLVTRDEMLDNLWQGRVVSDTSVSNQIKSARKVLGDNGQKQAVIKTFHGRGYQFIAKCENDVHAESEQQIKKTKISTIKIQSLIIILILVALAIFWFRLQTVLESQSPIDMSSSLDVQDKSIAVLAFKDLSPKSDQEYFSEGISEELLNLFTKIPDLRVASRTSSFSFKNKSQTIKEIGARLNVSYVMEGSVRKSGNKLRITAQLIRAKDGSHIWSETYDYDIDDIFVIQDKIALAVTELLKINLSNDLIKSTTVDTKAYALYLQSIYLIRQNTEKTIRQAAQIIGQSISIDPNYAPSWTLFSRIMYMSVVYSYKKINTTGFKLSKTAVQKALEIDDNYAHAYAQLSLINNLEWDFEASTKNVERASKLNNSSATIKSIVASNRLAVGRLSESVELLLQAIDTRKLVNHYYLTLGSIYLMQNRLEEAYEALKKYDYFFPEAVSQHAIMSFILHHMGRNEEALIEAEKEVHEYWKLSAKIVATHALGKIQESNELFAQYKEAYSQNVPAFFASLHVYRGDIDSAFKWLEIAYQQNDPGLIVTINFLPMRKLWDDNRWKELIQKLNLPEGHWLLEK